MKRNSPSERQVVVKRLSDMATQAVAALPQRAQDTLIAAALRRG